MVIAATSTSAMPDHAEQLIYIANLNNLIPQTIPAQPFTDFLKAAFRLSKSQPKTWRQFLKTYSDEDITTHLAHLTDILALPVNRTLGQKRATAIKALMFEHLAILPTYYKHQKAYTRCLPGLLYHFCQQVVKAPFKQYPPHPLHIRARTNSMLGNFLALTGNSGSYVIAETINGRQEFLAIVKPGCEEPMAPHNPFWTQRLKRLLAWIFSFTALETQAGQGMYAEKTAYDLSAWILGNQAGSTLALVPLTEVIRGFPILKCRHWRHQGAEHEAAHRLNFVDAAIQYSAAYPFMHHQNLNDYAHMESMSIMPAEDFFDITHQYKVRDKTNPKTQMLRAATPPKFKIGFRNMAVLNYIMNDVDKHAGNWMLCGDHQAVNKALSDDDHVALEAAMDNLHIVSIDNGAALAKKQQRWWHFLQMRNRLNFHRLPIAHHTILDREHIQALWSARDVLVNTIYQNYSHEAESSRHQRALAALERLGALVGLVTEQQDATIADMCKKIRYRRQIKNMTKSMHIRAELRGLLNPLIPTRPTYDNTHETSPLLAHYPSLHKHPKPNAKRPLGGLLHRRAASI